ncbi:MAG: nucleotide-binding universal stress UspA family protein [Cellvibrionaceae bacterium]|jgi:nucleotide-binding universal stress UspA family protein
MFKKILVPLDRSPLAEKALPYALSLAEQYKAEILFLVVLQSMPTHIMGGEMSIYSISLIEDNIKEEKIKTQAYLSELVEMHSRDNVTINTLMLEASSVADGIVDTASNEQIDVIVKTTHGRSGPSRWLFGNVATKVLQQAPCPIFLVRVQ